MNEYGELVSAPWVRLTFQTITFNTSEYGGWSEEVPQMLYLMLHLPMQKRMRVMAMEPRHLRKNVYVVFIISVESFYLFLEITELQNTKQTQWRSGFPLDFSQG